MEAHVKTVLAGSDVLTVTSALKQLIESDPSAVVRAGGVPAVADTLRAQAVSDAGSRECFEQGCVLLMNVAGSALDGDRACAEALMRARAAAAVVAGLETHADSVVLELGEAAMSALMQLACVDLPSALAAGLAPATVRVCTAVGAGSWLLFLCARTLSWACSGGDAALQALRKAGCAKALLHVLQQARKGDAECGVPFGVPDALDQLQTEARRALSLLVSATSGSGATPTGGGAADSPDGQAVALYVLRDRVVLTGLVAKPQLNGAAGIVVSVGEPGCGPEAESGRYGVRIELPADVRGTGLKIKPHNLRLAPRDVAARVEALLDTNESASPLPSTLETKFGTMHVSVVEPGAAAPGQM
jgi:hypothetical protein